MNSIRNTLLVWLLAGVLTAIAVTAGLVYYQARKEANELSDNQMKQLVASMPQSSVPVTGTRTDDANMPDDFVVQVWDRSNGFRLYNSHEKIVGLPQKKEIGFFDVSVDGIDWRIYNAKLGETIVQVAQLASVRHQVAAQVALRTVAPMILLLPFLSILIWVTVGRSLAAVRSVAAHVQSRDASSLPSIPDQELPREIQPLTHAFNDLLARLRLAITAQRAFIADAAHELKTPLTALKLQMQLAQRARTEADRQAAFGDLRGGLERANHLVQQLLTLARQDPGAFEQASEALDLAALARSVAIDFTAIADERQTRITVRAEAPAIINGNPEALRIMLNNLLDNAIRYTPDGGQVALAVEKEGEVVRVGVIDNGPGIPEKDLSRVLDRFYRVPGTSSKGSGLGLAIVNRIAAAHDGRITLRNTEPGLHVDVIFHTAS
ncbi:MAG: sensor histidine kinase N-terminal domain-containing protein [Proteobacteria bacterium]|nr:sensor histidine kinase N-terminal domain-containing protein [Pseudomonadota bacterium]